jgi:hypothetical protein
LRRAIRLIQWSASSTNGIARNAIIVGTHMQTRTPRPKGRHKAGAEVAQDQNVKFTCDEFSTMGIKQISETAISRLD